MNTQCGWCDQWSQAVVARRRSKGPKLLVCDNCGGKWISGSPVRVQRKHAGYKAPRIGEVTR